MNRLSYIVMSLVLAVMFSIGHAQQPPSNGVSESPYPNELPCLKIYQAAKWKSIRPYESSKDDVERILGKPVLVYYETLRDYVNGYEDDPEWTIVISYLSKGGDLPDSLDGHVDHLALYSKKRFSLVGVEFSSVFERFNYLVDGNATRTVYYDEFGLRYSIYATDTSDGRFHIGDLDRIIYGPSNEATERYKGKIE